MPRKTKINPVELAQTLVDKVNDPEKLRLEKGVKVFHDNTFLMFKEKKLGHGTSLEGEIFQLNDETSVLKRLINNVVIPLGYRLPETYNTSIDWLENKAKVLDDQEYWEKRITILRENSPTLKKPAL